VTSRRQLVFAAVLIYVAAIAQARLAHVLRIGPAEPDMILVVMACSGVLIGGTGAVFLGLIAGLLTSALAVFDLGSTLASRTIAGAVSGGMHEHVIRDNVSVPPLVVGIATLTSNIVYLLMAPPHHLRAWALMVLGQILYNAVLSIPIYFSLRRIGIGRADTGPFGGET
jgi:hypothetical protein